MRVEDIRPIEVNLPEDKFTPLESFGVKPPEISPRKNALTQRNS